MSEVQLSITAPEPVPIGIARHPRLYRILGHLLGIGFWTYAIATLFVFDITGYFIQTLLPAYTWLLAYRLLFFAGAISTIWLVTPNGVFWPMAIYITCYPLALVVYHVPGWILRRRSWVFTIACVNAVMSFFTSLKYNFIGLTVLVVCFTIVVESSQPKLVAPAITLIAIILTALYAYRFVLIFRPSKVW